MRDLPQVRDAPRVDDRRPDIVDELLLNELLAVENGIEHLAHRNRRRRMLANQAEPRLQFRRRRIFEPEQMVRLEAFPQPRRLDRRQPMMRVVKQLHVGTDLVAQALEERRDKGQILVGAPPVLRR